MHLALSNAGVPHPWCTQPERTYRRFLGELDEITAAAQLSMPDFDNSEFDRVFPGMKALMQSLFSEEYLTAKKVLERFPASEDLNTESVVAPSSAGHAAQEPDPILDRQDPVLLEPFESESDRALELDGEDLAFNTPTQVFQL
jgi:hypothetical protein